MCKIIPSRIIYKNKMYSIETIKDDYIVDKYKIKLDDKNRIIKLFVDADHPNSEPSVDEFCLSDGIENKHISYDLLDTIEEMLETYNLNHSYFSIWNHLTYGPYNHNEYLKIREKKKKSLANKYFRFINKIKNLNIDII